MKVGSTAAQHGHLTTPEFLIESWAPVIVCAFHMWVSPDSLFSSHLLKTWQQSTAVNFPKREYKCTVKKNNLYQTCKYFQHYLLFLTFTHLVKLNNSCANLNLLIKYYWIKFTSFCYWINKYNVLNLFNLINKCLGWRLPQYN